MNTCSSRGYKASSTARIVLGNNSTKAMSGSNFAQRFVGCTEGEKLHAAASFYSTLDTAVSRRLHAVFRMARVRFKAFTLSGLFLVCSIQTKTSQSID